MCMRIHCIPPHPRPCPQKLFGKNFYHSGLRFKEMEGDVGGCGVHFILRTRDKKNLNITRSSWGCHKHSGTGNRLLSGGGEEVGGEFSRRF